LLVALWHNAETRAVAMNKLNEVEGILTQKHAEVAALERNAQCAIQKADEAIRSGKAAAHDRDTAVDQYERSLYASTLMQVQVTALKQRNPKTGLAILQDEKRCPYHLREFTWGYLRHL